MDILKSLANSFIFWAAWIIIPLIMEVLPAIGSFIILIKRKIAAGKVKKPIIYPEISIIVPVYNSEGTLEECIRSIYDSEYPNEKIRVFLVNNKGTDNSFAVYTECQKKYDGLHMQWMNAEQGKSRALNLAIYNSDGKYIVHIDSDGVLEPSALTRMIDKFEDDPKINCMTGAIMTRPDKIEDYRRGLQRLFRKLEFMEYAQAFLAGRNYASDLNAIYTISGAFSAFRKSAILKSQLYNTDTLAEDTQITFQLRHLQKDRVYISEKSIFFVDPIENIDKLYTQRQRWQRGSLEVSKMFIGENMKVRQLFKDINVKTLMYDHTFAFPRMIWHLALVCLMFIGYSGRTILMATLILFGIYTVCGYAYYASTCGFLSEFGDLRKYYARQWWVVPLLPFFNLVVFFIRLAGIINSINTTSAWRTRTLSEEAESFSQTVKNDFKKHSGWLVKLRNMVNADPEEMYGEMPLDKRLKGSVLAYIAVLVTAAVSVMLGALCYWSKHALTIGVNEIINTLTSPMQGAGGDTISRAAGYCLPPILIGFAVIVLVFIVDRHRTKKLVESDIPYDEKEKKAGRIIALRRVCAAASVIMLVSVLIYCDYCYDFKGYIKSRLMSSSIYEQYYVNPNNVSITSSGKTKNLIHIYVESLETTYASKEDGGYQEINYIPRLTKLAADNISFSNTEKLGGFTSTYASTWTASAIFSMTSGVPYLLPSNDPVITRQKIYASKLVTLGDILESKGYYNEFLCGSDGEFGGRAPYLKQHGNYRIYDYYSAIEDGYIDSDYFVWWGLEDSGMFRIAKDRLTEISESGRPFNFTLLTVDTHFPDGYVCNLCSNDYPQTAANVIKCADNQVCDFVEWCRQQPFYEDTVIVITGDHPRMDSSLVADIDWYDRYIYNCFINAECDDSVADKNRKFCTLDIFPTVLCSMGFDIEGDRLGLGTNMFSHQRTLVEEIGLYELEEQLQSRSEYYISEFAPELVRQENAAKGDIVNK